MATELTFDKSITQTTPAHRVYLKNSWADDWVLESHLYAASVTIASAPEINTARLEYRYGYGKAAGQVSHQTFAPLAITDHTYVKIEIDKPTTGTRDFYFVILNEQRDLFGDKNTGGGPVDNGWQFFTAFGLEALLMRRVIWQSQVKNRGTIDRAITFNAGLGRALDQGVRFLGNRNPNADTDGTYQFNEFVFENDASIWPWTVPQIIEYLFKWFPPQNKDQTAVVKFVYDSAGSDEEAIEWRTPEIRAEGKSVKQILDEMINRRFLAGYTFDVKQDTDGEFKAFLRVFGLSQDVVVLDSVTVGSNGDQKIADYSDVPGVERLSIQFDQTEKYERVRVIGSPLTSTFTASTKDGTLEKDWEPSDEAEYRVATGTVPTPWASDPAAKIQWLRQRRNEDDLRRVWRQFRIPYTWDGTAGDGEGTPDTKRAVSPQQDETLPVTSPSKANNFWWGGMRILPYTLLTEDSAHVPLRSVRERRPPFACVVVNWRQVERDSVSPVWSYLHSLGGAGSNIDPALLLEQETANTKLSPGRLIVEPNYPAIRFEFPSGPQHQLAGTENTGTLAEGEQDPALNYDEMVVTLSVEQDARLQGVYPETLTTANDTVRELVLYRPEYRLDYVAPRTVVDVRFNALERIAGAGAETDGKYLQDDRARIADAARMAFEWFKRSRGKVSFATKGIDLQYEIGWMITETGRSGARLEVNSVITSITWDLKAMRTSYKTAYGELDAGVF